MASDEDWPTYRERLLDQRSNQKRESFSWLTLEALLSSVNDVIGKGSRRLVNDLRGRWVAAQRAAPGSADWGDDLIISMPEATSFLVIGDTGEQDASQYAVAPALIAHGDAAFMVICSDLIYPAGDVNDYVDGFYRPYQDFHPPIFGLPGNHDWYDGLNGFMWNLCGAEALPREDFLNTSYSTRERLARRLWRRASAPRRDHLNAWRGGRRRDPAKPWQPQQPGPYFAIETSDLLVVGIDTGISGEIDREQAEWLLRVSRRPGPKILLTGKPLLVNHQHEPGEIGRPGTDMPLPFEPGFAYATVDELVRDPNHRYLATIGGDIHNYQHYELEVEGKGRLDHFVSGGGGAFMSATHSLPPADAPLKADKHHPAALEGASLTSRTLYPSRDDSLAYYSHLLVGRVHQLVLNVFLVLAGVAAATAAVIEFDLGSHARDALLIGLAAAIGLWLGVLALPLARETRRRAPAWRSRIRMLACAATGFALGLAGSWLAGDDFGRVVLAAGTITALGALVASILRLAGPRAWRSPVKQGILYLAQFFGALALVVFWAAPEEARPAVGALLLVGALVVLVPAVNLGLRWLFRKGGIDTRPISLPIAVLLSGLAVWLAIEVINGADQTRAGVSLLAALVVIVALPLVIDYASRLIPGAHTLFLVFTGGLVLLGLWLLGVHETWVPEAVAVAVVITATSLLGIVIAHLSFLGAISLLWRGADGELSPEEAREGVQWRDQGSPKPSDARVRRIVNLVHPGLDNPNGPLQSKLSEFADPDEPPFRKSFLRIHVAEGRLVVRCFGVTGEERGPEDLAEVHRVEIPMSTT